MNRGVNRCARVRRPSNLNVCRVNSRLIHCRSPGTRTFPKPSSQLRSFSPCMIHSDVTIKYGEDEMHNHDSETFHSLLSRCVHVKLCFVKMEWIIATVPDMPQVYLFTICSVTFVLYYLCEVVKIPIFACARGPFKQFLEKNVPLLQQKFWPTPWCFESRAQTVFASLLRNSLMTHIEYRREILTLQDGGEVALDWLDTDLDETSPVVVVLPGLTGESQADYIKCLVSAAHSIGVRSVVFNNRGLAGVSLKTPRLYCAANVEDISEVVKHVRKLNPHVQMGAAGISMGGLLVGNYLAENDKEASAILKAAMIISAPWNIFKGVTSIETPFLNCMLGRHLASNLCKTLKKCDIIEHGPYDMEQVFSSKTIKEFDTRFTAKHFGYKDVDDYYTAATLHNKLDKITIPLICLSAADDPFQPLDALPIEAAEKTRNIAFIIPARGGHIGFMEGMWPKPAANQYMSRLFAQYFAAMFHAEYDLDLTKHLSTAELERKSISL